MTAICSSVLPFFFSHTSLLAPLSLYHLHSATLVLLLHLHPYVERRPRNRTHSLVFALDTPTTHSFGPFPIVKMVAAKITTIVVLALAAADAAVSTIVVTKPVA